MTSIFLEKYFFYQRQWVLLALFVTGMFLLTSISSLQAQPVRGVYVAGGGGVSFNQGQQINPKVRLDFPGKYGPPGSPTNDQVISGGKLLYNPGYDVQASVGYGLGNGFRVEIEGMMAKNEFNGLKNGAFPNDGSGHQMVYGGFANAFFDMDIGLSWIYPYIGFGVGYEWQNDNMTLINTAQSSNPYTEHIGGTTGAFAYQAMGGASFPIPWMLGLSGTLEYRFNTMIGGHGHSASVTGTPVTDQTNGAKLGPTNSTFGTKTYFNDSILLGLRYEFNPIPPNVIERPVIMPPAPPPAAQRTYMVFFDWNSTALTPRAREIIGLAARNSTNVQYTKILVKGYSDTSGETIKGGPAYNDNLSYKRADNVKAELVHDGVAAGLVSVKGLGATNLLMPTGPGVRDSQNRRVEINFN
ncbi:OmpA family protein [Acetobacteraceae bacterium]|nr:OmpA family protein [Acetobacteraceae bacterium]